MASTAFDWSKLNPTTNTQELQYESAGGDLSQPHAEAYTDPSLPAGYKLQKVAGTSGAATGGNLLTGGTSPTGGKLATVNTPATTGIKTGNTDTTMSSQPSTSWSPQGKAAAAAAASGGTGGGWEVVGPDGTVHKQGDAFDVQTDTGQTTGGFDDAFYNKYKQAVLDYYMPQVDKQYKDAKDQATYGLARSGNIRSSAANTLTADLATQNDVNQAGVRNQADTAAGDLRSQVNTEEQKATSQLYATEDPEVAAQQSLASVRDISLQQPTMSPLSALFNVATIGGANVLKGYQGQQALNSFNGQVAKSTGHVVPS